MKIRGFQIENMITWEIIKLSIFKPLSLSFQNQKS